MWLSTPSVDTLTRPRIAVAVVSAVAAVSIGYYAYQASNADEVLTVPPTGAPLHRSNALRRSRRRSIRNETASSSSSETPGDENADVDNLRLPGDGETVVDPDPGDDWWNDPSGFPPTQRAGHNIVNLLFRVSEDNARRNGCVHRGCQCNACGMVPIRGVRYRCANCADFDLCETCEAQGVHIKTHIFYKIRVPAPPFGPRQMQPVWYTGDPDTCRRNLPRGLIARLSRDTGFERPELEAFWEQWTFMANTEWRDDPDELCVAMDRKTFERCLVPTGGSRHAAPNLIHDRMFSFYDSNNDDLIGFSEFLYGLSYRKRKDKLRKVFEGYDIDGDGFVNRRDFLRMFRAYYVLYKQMHKDILDGLEDQLLASTEAQQLVSSRQPLSSLFGREGRIPQGDSNMRFEGKSYRRDGEVDVSEGYDGAFVENRGDTATREDILTSLFAYDTDHRPRRRFITRNDTDTNWRTVRRLSGTEADRTYWVTLLEPPATLEDIPSIFGGNNDEDETDEDEDDQDEDGDGDDYEGEGSGGNGRASESFTESESRARTIARNRKRTPKLEKKRRDMARKQLHDRWKRRQFYLDEEEGGLAPDDWENDEDVLVKINGMVDDSKATDLPAATTRSRSSSKVRFAEDADDYEIRSNPSTSSRSIPERWGGINVPDAERDAGKEILYQVTQQAFNELLDTIFKKAEDLAVDAAESKQKREEHKAEIDAVELPDEDEQVDKSSESRLQPSARPAADKSLEELLDETGYTVVPDEPRNAGEFTNVTEAIDEEQLDEPVAAAVHDPESDEELKEKTVESEARDRTLPQFRPNTEAEADMIAAALGSTKDGHPERSSSLPREEDSKLDLATLQRWKRLNIAEEHAADRGGWGRLSFDEFEQIYKSQEDLGNRLDYLGSWIDFCIP